MDDIVTAASGSWETWTSSGIGSPSSSNSSRQRLIDQGVREWPVTGEVGMAAATLLDFHPDPADRFITATALLHGATLVTADDRILAWSSTLQRHDARH